MNRQISPAPVRKTVTVKAGIERAFAIFTQDMGRWWLKSHSLNPATTQKDVVIEPRPQGRWYEIGADGTECQWGHVIDWDPPRRLLLAWQLSPDWQFDPALITEVEVRFTSEGADTTRVDLEHRLLERFGERAEKMRQSFDDKQGWPGLLEAYAMAI
ncbi:SRPBCC family protein [Taklimakanibacter deserti]|uniref:SRPBCC family protein n=1 Tax=Taklimakanibacter deserti TaxID=2267839 RepID=UPI000E657AF1